MYQGFFRIAYTGATGVGLGIFVLQNGRVIGADAGGATYDGEYIEDVKAKTLKFTLTMNVPAGVPLVQTGLVLTSPMSVPINITLPQESIEKQIPTLVEMAIGPVNVIFTKLRDI